MRRFSAAILGCAGPVLTAEEKRFFQQTQPFGFILFARNIENGAQLRALTSDLRMSVGWDAPILIDQEGGRVQRLRPPLARDWFAPLDDVARYGPDAARAMQLRYHITALELRSYGIDVNCAPALDVARAHTHPVLRNRLYGDTPERVIEIGHAVVRGHLAGGVLPVMKHMPGLGLGSLDTHLELPRVDASRAHLDSVDFAAFAPFADLPMGMTTHLVFDRIDPRPATQSPPMIDVIRRDIGFGGLLMTDDISMEALSGSVAERGAAALAAGCDVILHCNGDMAEMQSLVAKLGTMSDLAQSRAEQALGARKSPDEVDMAALEADLRALTERRVHD